jgi:hypothetical protein
MASWVGGMLTVSVAVGIAAIPALGLAVHQRREASVGPLIYRSPPQRSTPRSGSGVHACASCGRAEDRAWSRGRPSSSFVVEPGDERGSEHAHEWRAIGWHFTVYDDGRSELVEYPAGG